MIYTYCRGWFRPRAAPTEVWDERKARRAHERGKLYTVIVGPLERPECFLHVRLEVRFIGVNFLDRFLRVNISYQFDEVEPGRMFLDRAIEVEFDRDAPQDLSPNEAKSVREIRTVFKPTGWVDIWRRDMITGQLEHAAGRRTSQCAGSRSRNSAITPASSGASGTWRRREACHRSLP